MFDWYNSMAEDDRDRLLLSLGMRLLQAGGQGMNTAQGIGTAGLGAMSDYGTITNQASAAKDRAYTENQRSRQQMMIEDIQAGADRDYILENYPVIGSSYYTATKQSGQGSAQAIKSQRENAQIDAARRQIDRLLETKSPQELQAAMLTDGTKDYFKVAAMSKGSDDKDVDKYMGLLFQNAPKDQSQPVDEKNWWDKVFGPGTQPQPKPQQPAPFDPTYGGLGRQYAPPAAAPKPMMPSGGLGGLTSPPRQQLPGMGRVTPQDLQLLQNPNSPIPPPIPTTPTPPPVAKTPAQLAEEERRRKMQHMNPYLMNRGF